MSFGARDGGFFQVSSTLHQDELDLLCLMIHFVVKRTHPTTEL